MQALCRYTLSLALLIAAVQVHAWEPPASPDPDVIVNEAFADTANGRFADAAQKHLWYHDNAVRLKREHAQVRLTFVLEEWVVLARKYPPAMQDLLRVRSRAIDKVKAMGPDLNEAFTEVIRINEMLGDAESTRSVYADLGQRDAPTAARLWMFVIPSLAATGDHALAYSYLQIDKLLEALEGQYTVMMRQPGINAEQRAQMQAQISRHVDLTLARVVWVLLKSEQPYAAKDVANRGKKMLEAAGATPLIDAALRGEPLPADAG